MNSIDVESGKTFKEVLIATSKSLKSYLMMMLNSVFLPGMS